MGMRERYMHEVTSRLRNNEYRFNVVCRIEFKNMNPSIQKCIEICLHWIVKACCKKVKSVQMNLDM